MEEIEKQMKILRIGPGLSLEEIKKTYRETAMRYHPDRNHGFQEEAEQKMKAINAAYEYIRNNYSEYKEISSGKKECPQETFHRPSPDSNPKAKDSSPQHQKDEFLFLTLFNYEGRLGRFRYIFGSIFVDVAFVPLLLMPTFFSGETKFIISMLLIVLRGSLTTKRWYDLGFSVYHLALPIIAIITLVSKFGYHGLIFAIIGLYLFLMFYPGTDGPNIYGEKP